MDATPILFRLSILRRLWVIILYTLQVTRTCVKAAISWVLCVVAGFVTVYANQTATFQGSAAPEGQVDTARCRKTMLCTHMCASVKVVEVIYLKGIWLGWFCR